jgi:hypothetical protein
MDNNEGQKQELSDAEARALLERHNGALIGRLHSTISLTSTEAERKAVITLIIGAARHIGRNSEIIPADVGEQTDS